MAIGTGVDLPRPEASVHESLAAFEAMQRAGDPTAHLFEEFGVVLARPLVLARGFGVVKFLPKTVFFVSHVIPPCGDSLKSQRRGVQTSCQFIRSG